MAHWGWLNILTCVAKKPFHELFSEFEETNPEITKSKKGIYNFVGDVSYH